MQTCLTGLWSTHPLISDSAPCPHPAPPGGSGFHIPALHWWNNTAAAPSPSTWIELSRMWPIRRAGGEGVSCLPLPLPRASLLLFPQPPLWMGGADRHLGTMGSLFSPAGFPRKPPAVSTKPARQEFTLSDSPTHRSPPLRVRSLILSPRPALSCHLESSVKKGGHCGCTAVSGSGLACMDSWVQPHSTLLLPWC